jgi:hypothetical protein
MTRLAGVAIAVVTLAVVAGCLPEEASPRSSIEDPARPSPGSSGAIAATPAPTIAATASPALPSPSAPTTAGKPGPCPGTDRTPGAAAGRQLIGVSDNWSGYVAAVRKTGVTCVEASWIEPDVNCPKAGRQAVAVWIGMDGFSSSLIGTPDTNVLVQIGTQATCQDGVEIHGAWREVLPEQQREVQINGTVHAGDHISARVLYTSGHFVMTIFDQETGLAFSITATAPGAPRKSADWIVEAPATDCPSTCLPVPMPYFTPVRFTNAHATIGGQKSSIDDNAWTHVRLRMSRHGILRTTTSTLTSGGTSFRVTWVHS